MSGRRLSQAIAVRSAGSVSERLEICPYVRRIGFVDRRHPSALHFRVLLQVNDKASTVRTVTRIYTEVGPSDQKLGCRVFRAQWHR